MIDSGHAGLEAETSRRAPTAGHDNRYCRRRPVPAGTVLAADAADLVPLLVTSESMNEV